VTGGEAEELARIRAEYDRRRREVPRDHWKVRLFVRQVRERLLLAELERAGALPLGERRVLDVGCGSGQWLADFQTWGAARERLAGIELDPEAVTAARARLAPGGAGPAGGEADIREGAAGDMPWPDESFDIVLQATMLSSILDGAMRRQVAAEMMRVLAPGGVILSYDMRIENPRNPNVRAVPQDELAQLFAGMEVRTRRVTLALPIARRLVRVSWPAAAALERTSLANTQLLAILRRPGAVSE
jgi:SAM-dependent methyltransferase